MLRADTLLSRELVGPVGEWVAYNCRAAVAG